MRASEGLKDHWCRSLENKYCPIDGAGVIRVSQPMASLTSGLRFFSIFFFSKSNGFC